MSFLTFPVTGNYKALSPGGVVNGNVKFTPNVLPGVPPHGTTGGTTYGIIPEPTTAVIANGVLLPTSTYAANVTLYSNDPQLNLSGALQYTVDFSDVTADGVLVRVDPFTFNAPADSTPVDLIAVSPGSALQIVNALPTLPVSGLSDATTYGKGFLTGPTDAASARTYLGVSGGGSGNEAEYFANLAAFPGTGDTTKEYVAKDTGKIYYWNGSAYIQFADKNAVGLGNVDNTSDVNKPVSTAQATALSGKQSVLATTVVKTGAYTAAVNDIVPCDATSAPFTVTLPTTPADKARIIVKKIDSSTNAVAVTVGGSDVFNRTSGSTTLSLTTQFASIQLQYTASSGIWYVIATDSAGAPQLAVNTQAVVEVPQLLKPTVPQPTRFPYGSKIQTVFASGHGWTKNASGTGSTGTVADDTTNFANGSQSLAITTAGVSVNTFAVSPAFSPTLDLSKNALVLKLRVNTWANLAQVEVLISNDATTAMSTTRATSGALASSASLLASDGDFFWVVVNPGQWTNQFSTVDKTAVTRVGVLPASNASGAVTVNVQEVWTRPGPSLPATVITFDDGYLTQLTQAKPYMDKYGFRGVCYPIRNLITNSSSTYMSVANLQALYDCGWDVSAHADTAAAHDSTNALLDSSISDGTASALSSFERELHDNKQWLLANGFNRSADFFAWPQGKFDTARLAIAREYYTLIRVYRPSLTVADADTYPFVDGGRLRQIAVQSGASPTAAATVTAALTAAWAAGKTVVLTFHGLGSVQSYEYPVASFQTIIDFIASSGYPVKTLSSLMRDNGIDTPVGKTDLASKADVPTGTPDGTKFYRDDKTWVTPGAALPSQTGNGGKFLTTDGTSASWGVGGSGGVAAQLFTASGTYTAPATGLYRVSAVGGGGSGGAGGSALTSGGVATQAAGAGGGSGEFVESVVSLTLGDTLAVTIGTGGAASTGGVLNGNAGTGGAAGVNTTVVGTATLTARGGSAGGNGGANTVTAPSAGFYGSGGTTISPGHAGDGGQTTTASGFQGGAGIGLVAKGGGGGVPANATNGGFGSSGVFSSSHTGTTTGGNASAVTANTGAGGNGGGGGAPGGAGGNGSAGASGLVLIERIS